MSYLEEKIPLEILNKICSYLTYPELIVFRKSFKKVIDCPVYMRLRQLVFYRTIYIITTIEGRIQ